MWLWLSEYRPHVCRDPGLQKRELDPLELGLQAVVRGLVWVLGMECGFFGTPGSAPDSGAVSLAPAAFLLRRGNQPVITLDGRSADLWFPPPPHANDTHISFLTLLAKQGTALPAPQKLMAKALVANQHSA